MNTKISIQIDLEQSRFDQFNPPVPVQDFLKQRVDAYPHPPSQLAQAIGYRNLSKGTRRIREWISSSTVPQTEYGDRFMECINTSRTELNQANRIHQQLVLQSRIYNENQFEPYVLRIHFNLLMTHAQKIITTHQWNNILLPKVGVFMYYARVPSIRLGQLLSSWQNGGMQLNDFMAVRVVGSPLSGTHKAQGFYRHDLSTWVSKPQIFPRLNDAIKGFLPAIKENSGWSLGQVIADLGGEIEPTQIFVEQECIGYYDYKHHILNLHHNEYDLSELFGHPEYPIGDEPNHESPVVMRKQNIQINGQILCHWNQDLPPIVAEQIVRIIWGEP